MCKFPCIILIGWALPICVQFTYCKKKQPNFVHTHTHTHTWTRCAHAHAQRNFIILCVVFVYRQIISSILRFILFHTCVALDGRFCYFSLSFSFSMSLWSRNILLLLFLLLVEMFDRGHMPFGGYVREQSCVCTSLKYNLCTYMNSRAYKL